MALHPAQRPAVVRFGLSKTINMGNYESMRVHVELEMPCVPNQDAIDSTYELAMEWVDGKLEECATLVIASKKS